MQTPPITDAAKSAAPAPAAKSAAPAPTPTEQMDSLITDIKKLLDTAAPLAEAALQLNNAFAGDEQSPLIGALRSRIVAAQDAIQSHQNWLAK